MLGGIREAVNWLGRISARLLPGRSPSNSGSSRGLDPTRTVLLLFLILGLAFLDPLAGIVVFLSVVLLATLISSVEIVQAYERRAVTVLGGFRGLLSPGLRFIPPFISSTYVFDLRTEAIDVPRQEAITADNSPVTADAVVYVRVVDAERTFLQVDDYRRATSSLAQTTLRAVIGDMELDETLRQREEINRRIREELQGPTDRWGVEVEMVEVREVLPTPTVRDAMEEQTSAERRRRAMILEAEGRKRAAVTRAEGDQMAAVLSAEGNKQASVLEAQGDAIATVLRARAADSMGERAIIDRGMETIDAVGQGDSSTFVLPQELTSTLGRYGRRLTGTDVATKAQGLDSLEFDPADRELLGLDSVDMLIDTDESENGSL